MGLYQNLINGTTPNFNYTVEYLHHYTDLKGINGILQKIKECIWASGIRYLNDSLEFKYVFDKFCGYLNKKDKELFQNVFKDFLDSDEVKKNAESVFVISFSTVNDSLSQWRGYGGETCGFSINFIPNKLRDYVTKLQAESNNVNVRLSKCYYQEAEHKEIICEYWNVNKDKLKKNDGDEVKINAWLDLCKLASCIKHPKFEEEQEWRIIIENPSECRIKHRCRKSYLVPYIEFDISHNVEDLIDSITIGPTIDKKITRSSISSLLGETGITLNETEIPYRNW